MRLKQETCVLNKVGCISLATRLSDEKVWFFYFQERRLSMKIALCTELRNMEWFESRLRSLLMGMGSLRLTNCGMRTSLLRHCGGAATMRLSSP